MTAGTAPVLEFEVSTERAEVPSVTFKLNGQTFRVRRPKLGIASAMVRLMDRPEVGVMEFGKEISNLMGSFLNYVELEPGFEPKTIGRKPNVWTDEAGKVHDLAGLLRGRSRLLERLNEPKDAFDIVDLEQPFRAVMEAMFGAPTGASEESSDKPSATGRNLPARTRSTRAKTSGTRSRASSSRSAKATR